MDNSIGIESWLKIATDSGVSLMVLIAGGMFLWRAWVFTTRDFLVPLRDAHVTAIRELTHFTQENAVRLEGIGGSIEECHHILRENATCLRDMRASCRNLCDRPQLDHE